MARLVLPSEESSTLDAEASEPSGPPLRAKRWTLGDSSNIVEGSEQEPLSTTVAWIVGPTLVFGVLLFAMFGGA